MQSIPLEAGEAEDALFVNAEGPTHPSEKRLREGAAKTSRKSHEVPVVGQELMFAALSNRAIHPEVREGGAHTGRECVQDSEYVGTRMWSVAVFIIGVRGDFEAQMSLDATMVDLLICIGPPLDLRCALQTTISASGTPACDGEVGCESGRASHYRNVHLHELSWHTQV